MKNSLDNLVYETAIKDVVTQAVATLITEVGTGDIFYASPKAATLFGYEPGALVGHNVTELILRDSQVALQDSSSSLEDVWPSAPGAVVVFHGKHRDGSYVPVKVEFCQRSCIQREAAIAILSDLRGLSIATDSAATKVSKPVSTGVGEDTAITRNTNDTRLLDTIDPSLGTGGPGRVKKLLSDI